jgi:DNA-binding HxlR family transcriptional regulator/putative sterol carrier protein
MPQRTYGQFEGLARALDVVGERWTLLLVRELLLGPRRYTDLLDGLPGIGTNLLARRLRALEEAGVVRKTRTPPPAPSPVYELTDRGRGLEPALLILARWGMESMETPAGSDRLRPGWGVLAMRTVFNPQAAAGVKETYEFRVDDDVFHVVIDDSRLEAKQGPAPDPQLVITTDVETFLAVGARQINPLDAVARGRAQVSGDRAAAVRCVEIFGLPDAEHTQAAADPGLGLMAVTMGRGFDPKAARGVHEIYEMHVEDEVFHLRIDDGTVETKAGPAEVPDFVFSTDVRTLMALAARQMTPLDAVGRGLASMKGDVEAAMRCVEIFGMRTS